ncbi:MAG TPA: divalent metal cation transporter [Candidatus Limnocylindrales bacterium]|nr:divalent metal cation transporter [Candidatus Limnocylindrales bacterium]
MSKFLEIFLGILTAMGGFVEVGELVFSVQAGAKFGYSLLWVVLLGTIGIIVYGEMAGRIAAVTKQPVMSIIRARTGFPVGIVVLVAANLVSLLTCTAEIGGMAMVLSLLVAWPHALLLVLSVLALLASVWLLSLQWIERVFGLLGLLLIAYMVTAVRLDPDWTKLLASFAPNIPQLGPGHSGITYAYFVVALASSIMLPYETYFYASGAIEDGWKPEDVTTNRMVAGIGFVLGSVLAVALVIVGADFLAPKGIDPELPGAAALAPASFYGQAGLLTALLGMLFAFAGAAIENALTVAYNLAQFFGWPWGKEQRPQQAARFTSTWIAVFVIAGLVMLTGVDPISLVEYSIVFAVVILPLTYLPVLMFARDRRVMGSHVNGRLASGLGWFYLAVVSLAALAAIPLLILSHGGAV